jgi:hypothetical protein
VVVVVGAAVVVVGRGLTLVDVVAAAVLAVVVVLGTVGLFVRGGSVARVVGVVSGATGGGVVGGATVTRGTRGGARVGGGVGGVSSSQGTTLPEPSKQIGAPDASGMANVSAKAFATITKMTKTAAVAARVTSRARDDFSDDFTGADASSAVNAHLEICTRSGRKD